jgi:hypothetical protein
LINEMVARFLSWRLPSNFMPDGGITFDPVYQKLDGGYVRNTPTGTNLLDYTQARDMLEYVLGDTPKQMQALEQEIARLKCYGPPEFYVNSKHIAERALAKAGDEVEAWKQVTAAANKRASAEEALVRSLRAKVAKLEEETKK